MASGPYSRVYWSLLDEYPDVWNDDHQLATYVRCLVDADASWPLRPRVLPRSRAFASLRASSLISVVGSRYIVKGLDAERERRAAGGRAGGVASGKARSNQGTNAERSFNGSTSNQLNAAEPSQDETEPRRAEQARAGAREGNGTRPASFMGWRPNLEAIEAQHEADRQRAIELRQKREKEHQE